MPDAPSPDQTPAPQGRGDLPVVAIVGAGQLARMTHQAAIALGQSLRVLAADPRESAALVAADVTIGDHTDLEDLRAFAQGAHALTFDHEHVPAEHLAKLVAEGVPVYPGPAALRAAQDKLHMRARLAELGAPMPAWRAVTTAEQIEEFAAEYSWPVVLKTPMGGYDGRGVWVLRDSAEATRVATDLFAGRAELLVEQCVEMRRELSAMVARSPYGQAAAWPVVETVQRDGVCVEVIAPAPGLAPELAARAQELAIRVANELDVVGVLAVELFETDDGVLVNELAMRPHNSGHWSIDGSVTSQFEQHLRAVLDYPLGATDLVAPVVVMANLLAAAPAEGEKPLSADERLHHMFAAEPRAKVHLYGKAARPGRKIGHVTVLGAPGEALEEVRARAARAARWLREGRP